MGEIALQMMKFSLDVTVHRTTKATIVMKVRMWKFYVDNMVISNLVFITCLSLRYIIPWLTVIGVCKDCISGGIFIVGGTTSQSHELHANHTEFINQAMEISRCEEPGQFPATEARYGMVGTYLGDATTIFCGGATHDYSKVYKDCNRYFQKYFLFLLNLKI